ncbi:hypothetical protein CL654_02010 [bacterium]|nr:hypothetical protein [bacterium]|tara:strand:+ start:32626 stop:33411 length:786 start_codon:yes stop_codon:yes gene_type:complete
MKKTVLTLVVLIVLILVFVAFSQGGNNQTTEQESQKATNAELIVSAEKEPNTFILERVVLDDPGFVAIQEVVNNKQGQIFEVSDYLEAGTYEDVRIFVGDTEAMGTSDIIGKFPVVAELTAILYSDDGDKGFNPFLDTVVEGARRYVRTPTGTLVPDELVIREDFQDTDIPVAATVTYTDDGFSPPTVEIMQGETVRFVNKSSRPMWVASNEHPAHTILSTFDQFGVSGFGEGYQYTFDQPGNWEYHDHVNASELGVVIVR